MADSPQAVNSLLVEEKYGEALTAVNNGLAKEPKNLTMLLQKGYLLIKLRQLDEAETHYLELVDQFPAEPEPMNNLGVVYQLKREYGKAISQLNATVQRFPSFTQAYENLGDTYIQIATAQYLAGRNRAPSNKNLVAKADLGQRFYLAAQENLSDAISRFDKKEDPGTGPAAENDNTEATLADFLRSWVAAWSSRDTDAYFAHYAENFKPGENRSRNAWQRRKKGIIDAAKFINIRVEQIKIEDQSQDQVTLTFKQNYESNTYKSESLKRLVLNRVDGNWLIVSES
ncbi:MAG: SnoaL-like domain-containing protein [Gammaproteobacteria bacterium]|nr:SnoaL-like domain-containing protein [Gammaproteobacteria bacterium]